MQGMVTRSRIDDIRVVGRNTQGVRVMNLNEGDRIVSIAKVAQENVVDTNPPAEGETPAQ
jgi:DNA gyrase subunit A